MFIMQGVPGSGKSTLARQIADKNEAIIFSTDDFWIHRVEHDVVYDFDVNRLGEAHRWNQRRCAEEMMSRDGGNIVIDNTNIQRKEAQPYLTLAKIFNYDVQVVRVEVPVEVAIARNILRATDRQVPESIIRRKHEIMERLV